MSTKRTLHVRVSAGAKTEKVEELGPDTYKVRVSAPPERGKANARVLELLSKHLGLPLTSLIIHSGHTSRNKVIIAV